MGSYDGVLAVAAKRAGVSFDEYCRRRQDGLKRCFRCKRWLDYGLFGKDDTRADFLKPECRECSKDRGRKWWAEVGKARRQARLAGKLPKRIHFPKCFNPIV